VSEARDTFDFPGDDGAVYRGRVLDFFEFRDREYALVVGVDQDAADPNGLTIMRVTETACRVVLEMIDSDEEFERVLEYVRLRAAE
jgi:hypothetical protein